MLLACRIGFQSKAWSLPTLVAPKETQTPLIDFARGNLPDFQTKGDGARAVDLRRRPERP